MTSRTLKFGVSLLIGIIISILVLYYIGLGDVFYHFSRLDPIYYSLSLISILLVILFQSLRWKLFLSSYSDEVSTFTLYLNVIVGLAVNNLTPIAKAGGEPIRAYLLNKDYDIQIGEGLASVLSDLTAEFLVSAVTVLVSVCLMFFYMNPPYWLGFIFIVFVVIVTFGLALLFGIYREAEVGVRIINWVADKVGGLESFRELILEKYKIFQEYLRKNLKNRKRFSKAIIYSIMVKIFCITRIISIFFALGYEINTIPIVIAIGVSLLLSTVPATPGSLGIYEGGLVSTFILLGVPPDVSAAAVFLDRLAWFWAPVIVGSSLGLKHGIDISSTRHLGDKIEKKGVSED